MNDILLYPGPSTQLAPWVLGFALLLSGIAAFTDFRTGHIPNWLTIPPMVIGPLMNGLVDGSVAALASLAAMVICGAVPLLMFWKQGMHGGDTKLFIGIAALCGSALGLESQLISFIVASIYAMAGRTAEAKRLLSEAESVVPEGNRRGDPSWYLARGWVAQVYASVHRLGVRPEIVCVADARDAWLIE